MQLYPDQSVDECMESVLQTAEMVVAECQRQGRVITCSQLQGLLFYVQGWSLVLAGEPRFSEAIDLSSGLPSIAVVDDVYRRFDHAPIMLSISNPVVVDDLLKAIVATYGALSMHNLAKTIYLDYGPQSGVATKALTAHFLRIAQPEYLRRNKVHGLFVDMFSAKKRQLVDWSPPREATSEDIARIQQFVFE